MGLAKAKRRQWIFILLDAQKITDQNKRIGDERSKHTLFVQPKHAAKTRTDSCTSSQR